PHPTVRREATVAIAELIDEPARQAKAIQMLGDADPTVREAAAKVLTPMPSTQALAALVEQLNEAYVPLHEALRQALVHPGDDAIRRATIDRAAEMLSDANPRRREDASYVLGGLHSNAAIEKHVALLLWDPKNPAKADWPLIAQAAESMGFTGEASLAVPPLMILIKAAPDALEALQRPQRDDMANAMAGA